jgi:hypothetical protein
MQTLTLPEIAKPPTPMPRHLVPLKDGVPEDKALCGYEWDRMHVAPGPLCEECVEEAKRRHGVTK